VKESNKLRDDANFDNDFRLFDEMLKLDPELNGAVRAVSLTANNYTMNYQRAKNKKIRDAIQGLLEVIDFDDILINAVRNLMLYGNDINKIEGSNKDGITKVISLPVAQITILDDRAKNDSADSNNPVMVAEKYYLREGEQSEQEFPADEVLHIRMDFRSNWFSDNENRTTYGLWGESRFTSLKQAIRAKYNTLNNRISLEDSLTKQFITIDTKAAVGHIQDAVEQKERLSYIMEQVIETLEALRGDQIPIFPDYVSIRHIDQRTALPDSSLFLDSINGDIAAVLQVPRVAAGQERGSTFAATYTASVWASSAIRRMQAVVRQSIMKLFSMHLTLMNIEHTSADLPDLIFEPIDEETRLDKMRRASIGMSSGILSLNQSLEVLGLPTVEDGDERKSGEKANTGTLPRENSQEGANGDENTEDSEDEIIDEDATEV
jgi:hypothetical protein